MVPIDGHTRTSGDNSEVTYAYVGDSTTLPPSQSNATIVETPPVGHDIVWDTNTQSFSTTPNIELTPQESQRESASDYQHVVYRIPLNNGRTEGPSNPPVLETGCAEGNPTNKPTNKPIEVLGVTQYDVVDLSTLAADTTGAVYCALDHTKPRGRKNVNESEGTYNTLQHANNSRIAHSASDSQVLPSHVSLAAVYATIDKPEPKMATAPQGLPVYSTLGMPMYSTVNKKSKIKSTMEQCNTGLDNLPTTESNTAEDPGLCGSKGVEEEGQDSLSTGEDLGGTLETVHSPQQSPDYPPKSNK